MKTKIDCFPCFLKQTVIALKQLSDEQDLYQKIIKDVLSIMQEADISKPPAYTTTFIHRAIRNSLGVDPFKKIKYDYNNIAMGLYPELKEKVRNSKDPLWTATRLAIAGNVIDFGIFTPLEKATDEIGGNYLIKADGGIMPPSAPLDSKHLTGSAHTVRGRSSLTGFTSIDIESSIERALEANIAVDDYQSFKEAVQETDDILYLLDNSGEIVFDKLLIETLMSSGKRVKAVVKGSPVLNDVTYEDAVQIGLTGTCEVIVNGSDAIGTILEWTSPEFQKEFSMAKLIISKGQGNFETLIGTEKKTYFLFQSKCDVVSKELGLSPGSMLLKKS